MDQWSKIRYFRQRGQHVPRLGSICEHDQLNKSPAQGGMRYVVW